MFEKASRFLELLPRILVGILVLQSVMMLFRSNPVANLEVPRAPHWHMEDKSPTNAAPAQNGVKSTPSRTVGASGSNSLDSAKETGHATAAASSKPVKLGTNTPLTATASTSQPPVISVAPLEQPIELGAMGGSMPGSGRGSPRAPSPLSPLVEARIDRIVTSELLAPVFHPPPMALLGIAGHDAFLRTPNGQMTLLREGAEADGLKLLRIGTNRVLVEHANEKKELMIFEGMGGESLLAK